MMRNQALEKSTYLLTYAAPTTRRMHQFSNLIYFSVPPLPSNWKAPDWLRLELGLYAGRLYFDWSEYKPLCKLMGIEEGYDEVFDEGREQESNTAEDEEATAHDAAVAEPTTNGHPPLTTMTKKAIQPRLVSRPLRFLQEWLTVRRRGQDFAQSPMGFLAQGKTLQEDHPFFQKMETEGQLPDEPAEAKLVPVTHATQGDAIETDDYHGVDDMGANEIADADAAEDEVEYNDSEFGDDEIEDEREYE